MLPRWLIPAVILALLLTACGSLNPAPTDATAAPTRRPTRTPSPTETPTVTPSPFPTFTPTATIPPQFQTTPAAEQVVGPFIAQMALDWAAPGVVSHLFAESGETVWLATTGGAARLDVATGIFEQTKFERPAAILGLERAASGARLWLIRDEGFTISAWDGESTTDYGRTEGWVLRAGPVEPPLQSSFVTAPSGDLWISTDRDVRRFDGERWRVFTATEL
ncbi:MAG TPA: hypothetical protein VFF68_12965, partial [Anaerolineaceae bacterium]|nr:hypothetical protein [Anaerolineaceae bacterium]